MTGCVIKVPENLTVDETADFIRNFIRSVGGDPDTLWLEDVCDPLEEPFINPQVTWCYARYKSPKKEITMDYQLGFHSACT